MPQNPFTDALQTWSTIENDPEWKTLTPNQQYQVKTFFYTKKVLGHPAIQAAIQAQPEIAPQIQGQFWAKEQAAQAKADIPWYNTPLIDFGGMVSKEISPLI